MHHILIRLFCFIGLSACTTTHVEINIHKDGSVEHVVSPPIYKPVEPRKESETITLPPLVVNPIPKPEKPKRAGCDHFILPNLKPTPTVPKEIQEKDKMPDDELIAILTEYARILRKTSIENHTALSASYKKYVESCKK